MVRFFEAVKASLDHMGGVTDEAPPLRHSWITSVALWGLWWAALVLLILAFSGQTSRFIYIDF
jgi:hypothetical protein